MNAARLWRGSNSERHYDDDGELKRAAVAKRLAGLVGSYPAGTPGDPDAYSMALIEHVMALDDVSFLALDDACRIVAESKTFLPAIAEVLKVLREQQQLWRRRMSAIDGIKSRAQAIASHIARIKPALDAAAAALKVKEARQELDRALYMARREAEQLIVKQTASAAAAKAVEAAFKSWNERKADITNAEAALADAMREASCVRSTICK